MSGALNLDSSEQGWMGCGRTVDEPDGIDPEV